LIARGRSFRAARPEGRRYTLIAGHLRNGDEQCESRKVLFLIHRVKHAIGEMVESRLMLCEDTVAEQTRLINAGLAAGVPQPAGGVLPTVKMPEECTEGRERDDDRNTEREKEDRDS
jgi:hypothetical protein